MEEPPVDETIVTEEVTELFGELCSSVARFVQIDDVTWVNPENVCAVVAFGPRANAGCFVHVGEVDALVVNRPASEVVALLTDDLPAVDPNQLEIPGVV
jgi:hypothetical protein